MPTKKHRVSLSIEKEIWDEFKKNLKESGLPPGTASYLVQNYLERINLEIEHTGTSPQLELFGADYEEL